MSHKSFRIRDPLHNLVEFKDDEFENAMWAVLQTRPFQRLRRIKQLGFSELVYPGATHTRFAHSVGVFHTARQLMTVIERHLKNEKSYQDSLAKQALAAALLHDVGHGPFSHAFEAVGKRLGLKMAKHELISDTLIRDGEIPDVLKKNYGNSGFASDVADIIKGSTPGSLYSAVVSSQFDADRLDYMRRDRLMTGTQLGAIDFDWLLANIQVGKVPQGVVEKKLPDTWTFVLGPKALYAAETFVLSLFQLYPTVYLHKTTRGAEKLFTELLFRVIRLIQDNASEKTGLSKNHPIVAFAREPEKIDHILNLDDMVVWGSLPMMKHSKDKLISEFSYRLADRRLYKCIDIREQLIAKIGRGPDPDNEKYLGQAQHRVNEKIKQWLTEDAKARDTSRLLLDSYTRNPYKRVQEDEGKLNQILIKGSDGELHDVETLSETVRAIKTFVLFRVYYRDSDDEAREFVLKLIDEEVKNAKKN